MFSSLYEPEPFGGAEVTVDVLARQLLKDGHEVSVVSTEPGRGVRSSVEDGIRVHRIGLVNVYWPFGRRANPALLKPLWHLLDVHNPWMVSAVGELLELEKPDIVHTHNVVGLSTGAWREVQKRRLPLVHTLQDHALLCLRAMMFRRGKACERRCAECRIYSAPKRPASEVVDLVVGVSRAVLDAHVEAGFFEGALREVIPQPVSPPDGIANGNQGHGSGCVRFGYLGRLHPGKGIDLLLDALARSRESRWELLVGGSGTPGYEKELREAAAGDNRIRFVGRVSPGQLLGKIDVLVVPSRWHEGSPRVIPEAYAFGVPVLGTRRGGIEEAIDDGRTGFTFEPEDRSGLTALIERVVQDGPGAMEEMRATCRRRAHEHRPEVVTTRYLEAYRSATDHRRA